MRRTYLAAIPTVIVLLWSVLAPATALGDTYPQAPDFTLKDLNGNRISLSDFRGKVLFLNFWATWCPPCRAEIPDFIEAYKEYKDEGLEILGISVDQASPDKVRQFVEKNSMNYRVAMFTADLINDYQPGRAIPTTIIIDREGRIRHKQVGMMSKKMLVELFTRFSQDE